MCLSKRLFEQKTNNQRSSPKTRNSLIDLIDALDDFFQNIDPKNISDCPIPIEFLKQYQNLFTGNLNMRIATVDMLSVFKKNLKFLQLTERDPRHIQGGDGCTYLGKILDYSSNPPCKAFDDNTVGYLHKYLKRLFSYELGVLYTITKDIIGLSEEYRALVSVDYYPKRSVDNHLLHKDTTGTTLFVALHYANEARMRGPEYVYDYWEIPAIDIDENTEEQKKQEKLNGYRRHAPWQKFKEAQGDHDYHNYWPDFLLEALENAKKKLPTKAVLHHIDLEPYGLVSFVDELLYHATPLGRQRKFMERSDLFQKASISGRAVDLPFPQDARESKNGQKLKRTLSGDIKRAIKEGEEPLGVVGDDEQRTFMRLWISIAPRDWYEEIEYDHGPAKSSSKPSWWCCTIS